ncbi:MAG: ABC transporter permease [Planctomycetes bacterium]|nr:ABC transporter permease [Planctomycetota bacterium]
MVESAHVGRRAAVRDDRELERLLEEAAKVRGNTLWSDARRRFRSSPVARWSLRFLILAFVVSFFAPLLPLAPHARVRLSEKTLAPFAEPLRQDGLFFRHGWPERFDGGASEEDRDALRRAAMDRLCADAGVIAGAMIRVRASIFGDFELTPLVGTDVLGRCLLSRILWGGRVSLMVGIVATLVSLLIGVTYGAFSGYVGGRVDQYMMRFVDVLYSIPFIFIVIFLMTFLRAQQTATTGRGDKILVFFVIIGAIYWLTMARVVRGQVLSLKHREFVEASKVLGGGTWHVLMRHVLPNVMSVVLVYLTLTIPRVMLFEAFLSFLGLGVEPPDVSWGMLAADALGAINPLRVYWWFVLFPSLALGSTLLALNFVGDGLRDALDPRLMEKRARR